MELDVNPNRSAAVVENSVDAWLSRPAFVPSAKPACVGLNFDWFEEYPQSAQTQEQRKRRQVCASCPVARECAEYAIANRDWVQGMWAGVQYVEGYQVFGARRSDLTVEHHLLALSNPRLSTRRLSQMAVDANLAPRVARKAAA